MYEVKIFDDMVPFEIHKAAYEYCFTRRWYTGYRNMPPLDMDPAVEPWEDVPSPQVHRSITRAPFAGRADDLALHKPIEDLFNTINTNAFNGKLVLDGLHEPSPGLKYRRNQVGPDTLLTSTIPFYEKDHPKLGAEWREVIYENGSLAYMQAQPYETHRVTRIPHRDWAGGHKVTQNAEQFSTIMFCANLVWKPEWFGEFTMFEDAHGDIPGAKFEDLATNRKIGVGWPKMVIANKPGRIVVQDGRQLHATRAVGETAPEPTIHINFRVRIER